MARVSRHDPERGLFLEVKHGEIPIEPRDLTSVFAGEKVEIRSMDAEGNVFVRVGIFRYMVEAHGAIDGLHIRLTDVMEHFIPVDAVWTIEEV